MDIKWYGTASISIESNNEKILFDPFVPMLGSKIDVHLDDFIDYDKIFITHGNFDHIGSLKKIYKKNNKIKIYCTKTPYTYLNKKGIPLDNLVLINYNDVIELNGFKIKAYHSKHIMYDDDAIKKIILNINSYKYLYNVPWIVYKNKVCLENEETLFYDIEVENKHIFLMGSLGYDKDVIYPYGCDLFIMPYQGKKDVLTPALEIIDLLKPKAIMLSHFDNTFPPVSKNVSTLDIEEALKDKIILIKPKYKEVIKI